DRIRLSSPVIHLRRAPDGAGNWEDLLARLSENGGSGRPMPQIGGFEMRNGRLELVDERSGRFVQIDDWRLEIGAWRFGVEVPVETDVVISQRELYPARSAPEEPLSAAFRLAARVRVSAALDHVDVPELDMHGRVIGERFPADGLPF